MKTTLFTLLLFLSCNLMGQKTTATGYEIITDYSPNKTYTLEVTKINQIDERIVELWKEYHAECRNDSTVRYEDCSRNDGNLVGCYREIITYKKPTFEGFMLFIERKITDK